MVKKIIIIVAIAASLMLNIVLAASIINSKIKEPRISQEQPLEQEGIGGRETDIDAPEPQDFDYVFPLAVSDFAVTSEFGVRVSPILKVQRRHTGVDIASVRRAQVVAIADGTVVEHWPAPDGYFRGHDIYGGYLVVDHGGGVISTYAHLSTTYVHQGHRVKKGQVIGRTGNTGASRGDHLHFEVIIYGEYQNPLLYMPADIRSKFAGSIEQSF